MTNKVVKSELKQITLKKPSKRLDDLIEALTYDFTKLRDKVDAVFEQGRKEGFEDMQIGKMVRVKMKEHYSRDTIARVLPATAKQKHVSVRKPDTLDKNQGKKVKLLEVKNNNNVTDNDRPAKEDENKQPLQELRTNQQEKQQSQPQETMNDEDQTNVVVFQDSLDNLISYPQWEHDIETMDLANSRRLLTDAVRKVIALKEHLRFLNDTVRQIKENPKEYLKSQKELNRRFGFMGA